MKRLCDLLVAATLLLITAPLWSTAALLVALELHAPPIYATKRVGRHGVLFGLLRLRTMRRIDASGTSAMQLTRVGRWIRNYSLDELPSLLNVLWGDLSLIGPRAMEPERVDLADPSWRQILSVKPGLIGLAILRLARNYNAADPHVKQRLELEYVAHQFVRLRSADVRAGREVIDRKSRERESPWSARRA